VLVPCGLDSGKVGETQDPKPPKEDGFLYRDQPIQAGDRRLEKPSGLPIFERDNQQSCVKHDVTRRITQSFWRSTKTRAGRTFGSGAGGEREITEDYLAQHVDPQLGLFQGVVHGIFRRIIAEELFVSSPLPEGVI
jgi:hypothetical protein